MCVPECACPGCPLEFPNARQHMCICLYGKSCHSGQVWAELTHLGTCLPPSQVSVCLGNVCESVRLSAWMCVQPVTVCAFVHGVGG